ncbi:MAG: hypothetical protein HYX68_00680 [Planctomycetes bacterium]|nr:hypothetical protein [Planctomycetota bacterium]
MRFALSFVLAVLLPTIVHGQDAARPVRFMLHGNMSHELPTEEYLRFVEEAQPDILIMGVFDQRLYSLASPPAKSKRAPLDVAAHLAKWQAVANRLHKKNIRLIGQMELFVLSDQPKELEDQTGWFGFYGKQWNEKLLGPRPAKSVRQLLAHSVLPEKLKDDKTALCGCRVNTRAILGCFNNPHWVEVQKRMVKAAIDHGIDGFMTNRNFFEHCDCPLCQERLRESLAQRFNADQLRIRLGIANLKTHRFTCVAGTYRVHETVPDGLHLEKLRFAKERVREFFEEVYIKHGRGLKKDLFVAQWNHMAYFDELHLDRGHLPTSTRTNFAHAFADERWGVPANLWARGEDLLWYCNWGTTQNTILEKSYAGDTTLYGLYLRARARGKPYVINKYDFYRPRVMMAEAAALGYATNAIATPWQHEEDRAVVLRYVRFLRAHADWYAHAKPHAEVGLLFPRRAIHAGDASALEYVEACGRALIRAHRLFDMIPDDLLAQTPLSRYDALIVAAPEYLGDDELAALRAFSKRGGKLIWTPVSTEDRRRPGAKSAHARHDSRDVNLPTVRLANVRVKPEAVINRLDELGKASYAIAPWHVEVQAYRQEAKKRTILHLVNYNHKEKAAGKSVSEREAPIMAKPVEVRLRVPADTRIRQIRFLSPDANGETRLPFRRIGNTVVFTTPAFLVYGVCAVESE